MKNMITFLIVGLILSIAGFDAWLIYTQAFGSIIPVFATAMIAVVLTLIIHNLVNDTKANSDEAKKNEKK